MHPLHRVRRFHAIAPFTLVIGFDDETEQTICFEPVLFGRVFGPLRDETLFNQVTLDPQAGTLVWPNGADFDPATLHDWKIQGPVLARRAATWRSPAEIDTTAESIGRAR